MINLAIIFAYIAGAVSGFAFARGQNVIGGAAPVVAAIVCGLLYSYGR